MFHVICEVVVLDVHRSDAPHTSRKDRRNHATVYAYDAVGARLGGKVHVPIPKDLGLHTKPGNWLKTARESRMGEKEGTGTRQALEERCGCVAAGDA